MKQYKKVLTIATSDSGGGAGVQADIKTISACGCYAMSVLTGITAQNTVEVRAVHAIPKDMVEMQLDAVMEDIGADAVKLGMLPEAETVEAVAAGLIKHKAENIILDPVMVSTTGYCLISAQATEKIISDIFPISTLITPNIPETEFMTGLRIAGYDDYPEAVRILQEKGANSVLIKSGHIQKNHLTDFLFHEGKVYRYDYDRIDTPNTHGTGCTLSAAIASFLALGNSLDKAVGLAEDYVHEAIRAGKEYKTGRGHGPVHHFYKFW